MFGFGSKPPQEPPKPVARCPKHGDLFNTLSLQGIYRTYGPLCEQCVGDFLEKKFSCQPLGNWERFK